MLTFKPAGCSPAGFFVVPQETRLVDIWTVHLEAPREILITPDEQERAARFIRERDGLHWARARTALRGVLSGYIGRAPLDFTFNFGTHGKPSVAGGPEFNLSHSGDWAIIAVCGAAEVGIDIERLRENVPIAKLLQRIYEENLPESHAALFQRWTQREAATKAIGGRLLERRDERVCVRDLDAPPGYAASVAMVGFTPEPNYRGAL